MHTPGKVCTQGAPSFPEDSFLLWPQAREKWSMGGLGGESKEKEKEKGQTKHLYRLLRLKGLALSLSTPSKITVKTVDGKKY